MNTKLISKLYFGLATTSPISISFFLPTVFLIPRIFLAALVFSLLTNFSNIKISWNPLLLAPLSLLFLITIRFLFLSQDGIDAFRELALPFVIFLLVYLITFICRSFFEISLSYFYHLFNFWLVGGMFFNITTAIALLLFKTRLYVPNESIIDGIRYNHGFRLMEPTQTPVFLSVFGGLLTIYCLNRLLASRSVLITRLKWSFLLLMSLLMMITTFSRTGFLALLLTPLLSGLIYTITNLRIKNLIPLFNFLLSKLRASILFILFTIIISTVVLLSINSSFYPERIIELSNRLIDISGIFVSTDDLGLPSRHLLARYQAFNIFNQLGFVSLLFGTGLGGFSLYSFDGHSFPYSFNVYLTLLVETGLFGFSMLILWIFSYMKYLYGVGSSVIQGIYFLRYLFCFILLSCCFYELKAFLPFSILLGLIPCYLLIHSGKQTTYD